MVNTIATDLSEDRPHQNFVVVATRSPPVGLPAAKLRHGDTKQVGRLSQTQARVLAPLTDECAADAGQCSPQAPCPRAVCAEVYAGLAPVAVRSSS